MHVREGVRVRVPAAEAQVQPADARVVVVDDDDLFVVRPELDGVWHKIIIQRKQTELGQHTPFAPI